MKDKSGSAFPQPYNMAGGGMSLREYLAGQALAGILARTQGIYVWEENSLGRSGDINGMFDVPKEDRNRQDSTAHHVRAALDYADALLTELAKEGK